MAIIGLNGVAYCGLACAICHEETGCAGCRQANGCGREKVCLHKTCCIERGLNGCWECNDFPCNRDMHGPDRDIRLKAFVRYIRMHGVNHFIERLRQNQAAGIHYHHPNSLTGDYDGLASEGAVIRLLDTGCKEQTA